LRPHGHELPHGGPYEGVLYRPSSMPRALAERWVEASAAGEGGVATHLGGRWTPASVWRAVERMRRSEPRVQAMLDAELEAAGAAARGDAGRRRPKL
jgi:hypothetical protein